MRFFSVKSIFVSLLFVACALPAVATAYTSPGAPQGSVNDFAHVLTNEQRDQLEVSVEAYEARTSNEIAVVTVPTIGTDTVEEYAANLFQEWGIGKKTQDNGVLILLAIQDRKLRIEVGYGLEGVLTDAESAGYIQQAIPLLKEQNYFAAVDQLTTNVELLLDRAAGSSIPERLIQKSALDQRLDRFVETAPPGVVAIVFMVIGFFVLGILRFILGACLNLIAFIFSYLFSLLTGGPRPKLKKYFQWSLSGFFFGGGRGGFGGGSSGGGFGGGSSGGGGASGGW